MKTWRVINDAKKIWFFQVRARLLVHLNDPCVLNKLNTNDGLLVAITPNQVFYLVRTRLFIHLHDLYILDMLHVKNMCMISGN